MRKLEAEYDLRVSYVYFPLHPETPAEGRALSDLFAGREVQFEASKARLTEFMRLEGLPYGNRTHTYNSRLAQELAVWADGEGATDEMHDALFRAYFVDNGNLADTEVLVSAAAAAGLDPDAARIVAAERRYSDKIDEHWRMARGMGVTGVPTFISSGYGVVGAQPYEVLESLMSRAGAVVREESEE